MKHEHAQLCRKHGIEPSHAASDAAALGELVDALMREREEAAKQEPVAEISLSNGMQFARIVAVGFAGNDGDKLYRHPPNLPALLDAARKEEQDRLLFVLNNDAFIVSRNADHGSRTYQLWSQDEDEDYHVMHDKNEFFKTPIEAVDAAISHAAAIRTPQD